MGMLREASIIMGRDGQKLQKDFPGNKHVYLQLCNFDLYLQLLFATLA